MAVFSAYTARTKQQACRLPPPRLRPLIVEACRLLWPLCFAAPLRCSALLCLCLRASTTCAALRGLWRPAACLCVLWLRLRPALRSCAALWPLQASCCASALRGVAWLPLCVCYGLCRPAAALWLPPCCSILNEATKRRKWPLLWHYWPAAQWRPLPACLLPYMAALLLVKGVTFAAAVLPICAAAMSAAGRLPAAMAEAVASPPLVELTAGALRCRHARPLNGGRLACVVCFVAAASARLHAWGLDTYLTPPQRRAGAAGLLPASCFALRPILPSFRSTRREPLPPPLLLPAAALYRP